MSNAPYVEQSDPKSLPRILGLFDATALVVGSIIGSGIFLKVGNVDKALMAWGFLPIVAVWMFVGLVTLCGSLALAELAAMYPSAGGPYLYLREAYGRLPAFLWGWTEFWVVRTGSVGALACATAIYLDEFLKSSQTGVSPLGHTGQMIVTVSIVVGLTIVNVISTRWAASIQNMATIVKVVFLALLIVLPFIMGKIHPDYLSPLWISSPHSVSAVNATDANEFTVQNEVEHQPAQPSRTLLAALGVALIAVFWPYDGWINIGPVAEEIKNPQFNVPRALAVGIAVVTLVYVGANISYHLVLSMPVVASSERLASDTFRVLFGEWGSKFAALGVLCSTFGAADSNLIAGPRIYFAAARDGLVPAFIHKVHPVFKTPANSVMIQGVWATFLVVVFYSISTNPKQVFDLITDAVICAGLIFYSLTVAAVYRLRWRKPNAERPYKTWGYPLTPALMVFTYGIAFVGTLLDQWDKLAWVLALIAAGVVYYFIVSKKHDPTTDAL